MAYRLLNKIKCNLCKTFGTVFYSKKVDLIPPVTKNISIGDSVMVKPEIKTNNKDTAKTQSSSPKALNLIKKATGFERKPVSKVNPTTLHELQPAMLPSYYHPSSSITASIFPKPTETKYRLFEKSLTYRSVKLPLKKPRLANPFPDPVKVMPSDTISDQEKADQMQESARYRYNAKKTPTLTGFSQQRNYSTKSYAKPRKTKNKFSKKCQSREQSSRNKQASEASMDHLLKAIADYCNTARKTSNGGKKLSKYNKSRNKNRRKFKKITFTRKRGKAKQKRNSKSRIRTGKLKFPDKGTILEPFNSWESSAKYKSLYEAPRRLSKSEHNFSSDNEERELKHFPSLLTVMSDDMLCEGKKKDKCKKKFPFDGCKKKSPPKQDKCPKPKKKKKIKDCPPKRCSSSSRKSNAYHVMKGTRIQDYFPFSYSLGGKDKCPDVDTGLCEIDKKYNDKCKKETTDSSKTCPKDLLKRRKSHKPPKKKSQSVTTIMDRYLS